MNYNYVRSLGTTPRFHGAGFTQLPLPDNRRLHVWHPDLPPIITEGIIHDHKFGFKSVLMRGLIKHQTYDFTEGQGEASVWNVEKGVHTLDRYVASGELVKTGEYNMAPGTVYIFFPKKLHSLTSDVLSVTLIDKLGDVDWTPLAASSTQHRPGNAYPITPPHTEEELWDAIKEGLDD